MWQLFILVGCGVWGRVSSHVGMFLPHDVRPKNSILHRLTLTNRDAIGHGFSEGDISFFRFFVAMGKSIVDTSHQIIVVVSLSFPFSLIHNSHTTQIQYNTHTLHTLSLFIKSTDTYCNVVWKVARRTKGQGIWRRHGGGSQLVFG